MATGWPPGSCHCLANTAQLTLMPDALDTAATHSSAAGPHAITRCACLFTQHPLICTFVSACFARRACSSILSSAWMRATTSSTMARSRANSASARRCSSRRSCDAYPHHHSSASRNGNWIHAMVHFLQGYHGCTAHACAEDAEWLLCQSTVLIIVVADADAVQALIFATCM